MTVMEYKGIDYELAKYDVALAEEIEAVGNERDFRKKAESMYSLMEKVVGGGLAEIVDGDGYETCDLIELVGVFNHANKAYEDGIRSFEREQEEAQQEMLANLERQVALFNKAIKESKNNNR